MKKACITAFAALSAFVALGVFSWQQHRHSVKRIAKAARDAAALKAKTEADMRCFRNPNDPQCVTPFSNVRNMSTLRAWQLLIQGGGDFHDLALHTACDAGGDGQCYGEPTATIGYEALSAALRESACSLTKDDVVYDVGSGYGRVALSLWLSERVRAVKGVEIHKCRAASARELGHQLRRAVSRGPDRASLGELQLVQGDIRASGFDDATVLFLSSQCWPTGLLEDVYGRLAQRAKGLRCIINFAANWPHGWNATTVGALAAGWGHVAGAQRVPTTWGGATATFLRRGPCVTHQPQAQSTPPPRLASGSSRRWQGVSDAHVRCKPIEQVFGDDKVNPSFFSEGGFAGFG